MVDAKQAALPEINLISAACTPCMSRESWHLGGSHNLELVEP